MSATPPIPIVAEPSAVAMLIFDVPFAIAAEFDPAPAAANTPLPYNTVDADPSMLIEAMFPAPETFAKATALAVAALVTSPLTLAPTIADKPDPIPVLCHRH